MTVYNTFLRFTPVFRPPVSIKVLEAKIRGFILITVDGEKVGMGRDIIDMIATNPSKIFIVPEGAFRYLVGIGITNVCTLDTSTLDSDLTYGAIITP
jgi:hypothetical protein